MSVRRPICQWCGLPVSPHRPSTDDGYHLDCTPQPHPHAAALLSGERVPPSWVDEVIAADPELVDAIDKRSALTLDVLLSVLDCGAWAEAS